MTTKTTLVTGANRGIGLATARQLAELDMRTLVVEMACVPDQHPSGGFVDAHGARPW